MFQLSWGPSIVSSDPRPLRTLTPISPCLGGYELIERERSSRKVSQDFAVCC
jgi:hypothetical protein